MRGDIGSCPPLCVWVSPKMSKLEREGRYAEGSKIWKAGWCGQNGGGQRPSSLSSGVVVVSVFLCAVLAQ